MLEFLLPDLLGSRREMPRRDADGRVPRGDRLVDDRGRGNHCAVADLDVPEQATAAAAPGCDVQSRRRPMRPMARNAPDRSKDPFICNSQQSSHAGTRRDGHSIDPSTNSRFLAYEASIPPGTRQLSGAGSDGSDCRTSR